MKHRIITSIILLVVLVSCNNDIKVDYGYKVGNVDYSLTGQGSDEIKDKLNYNNPNVIALSDKSNGATNVSPIIPYRKGYVFNGYSVDGSSDLIKEGSVFEKAYEGQDVSLATSFKPDYSKYFTLKPMFKLTVDEIKSTGLGQHVNMSKYNPENPSQAPDVDITMNFVSIPGGYKIMLPLQARQSQFDERQSYISLVGLNKSSYQDSNKWVVEDYAIAETETPGALLKLIMDWNDLYNKGYDFGFDRQYPNATADPLPWYGIYCVSSGSDTQPQNRNSAYDPACYLAWDSMVVFCNALTEWYNSTRGGNLTFAYTEDGTPKGKPIKSVRASSAKLRMIDAMDDITSRGVIDTDFPHRISHVQGATGFRLPTTAEWMFAATVIPDNSTEYQSKQDSSVYPSLLRLDMPAGYKESSVTAQSVSKYSINGDNYGLFTESDVIDNGTDIVGKAKIKTTKTGEKDTDKLTNAIGLYDMTGNISECTENMFYSVGTDAYRMSLGGGYNEEYLACVSGFFDLGDDFSNGSTMIETANTYSSSPSRGFRLARTISTTPYRE